MTENPRDAMVWATPYLKNEFGDPRFFLRFFIESYHFLPSAKVLKKSVCGKFLGANVLNAKPAEAMGGEYTTMILGLQWIIGLEKTSGISSEIATEFGFFPVSAKMKAQ